MEFCRCVVIDSLKHIVGTELGGVGQSIEGDIDCDNPSTRECQEMLNGVCTQTAGTDDNSRSARWDSRKGPLYCVIGGRTSICQRSGDDGIKCVELDQFTRGRYQYITSKPAIDAVTATNDRVVAVVVLTASAPDAVTTGMGAHHRDGITNLKTGGASAKCSDMAPDLVTESEGNSPSEGFHKRCRGECHPDVRMTESVASHFDKDFPGARDRDGRLGQFRRMLPLDDAVRLHHFRHGLMMTWTEKSRPVAMGAALTGQDVSSVTRRNPWLK
jgi:hypothetical protein